MTSSTPHFPVIPVRHRYYGVGNTVGDAKTFGWGVASWFSVVSEDRDSTSVCVMINNTCTPWMVDSEERFRF